MLGWLRPRLCLLWPRFGARRFRWPGGGADLGFLLVLLALHVLLLPALLFLLLTLLVLLLSLLLLMLHIGTLFILPLLVLTLLIQALLIGGIGAGIVIVLIAVGTLGIRLQLRRRTGRAGLRGWSRGTHGRLRTVAALFHIAWRAAVRALARRLHRWRRIRASRSPVLPLAGTVADACIRAALRIAVIVLPHGWPVVAKIVARIIANIICHIIGDVIDPDIVDQHLMLTPVRAGIVKY